MHNHNHFALRGDKQISLSLNNFELVDMDGIQGLKYREITSKTFHGGLRDVGKKRKEVVAFSNEQDSKKSVVMLFQKFLSVRPKNVERFYLKPLNNPNNGIWYSSQAIGKNVLCISGFENLLQCWFFR